MVDGYDEHFRHSLGPADEATVALIDELLHVGVRCVGLSNWSAITWAGITDAYPALGRLEGVMISGEEGHCKPDEVIFRRCEWSLRLHRGSGPVLRRQHRQRRGARAVGWDAEVFTTARAARAALVRRGLLSV